jgi:hypothetical protein
MVEANLLATILEAIHSHTEVQRTLSYYFYVVRRVLAALKIHTGHNADMHLSESLRHARCKDIHNLVNLLDMRVVKTSTI